MKFNRFRKCGYYILIKFTQEANTWIVGGSKNKEIRHYQNGQLVDIETYNPIKVKSYIKDGIFVLDMTNGQQIPSKAVETPIIEQSLGVLEFHRRID